MLANLNLHPTKLGSIQHMIREEIFEEFQDVCHGGHLGYQNSTMLANMNLHVALMPLSFWFNHSCFGNCCLKNFKMYIMAAISILKPKDFCNIALMPPIKFQLN